MLVEPAALLSSRRFGSFQIVGHEMRSRYKFKRRTPYDFYDHAGESEFGVGV